jgi:chemotaxis regulatin CheY-phosphate phosphatase CheZ
MEEQPHVTAARQALQKLVPAVEQMATQVTSFSQSDKQMNDRIVDLTRLNRELEQRAVLAEQRAETLAAKADQSDRLDVTSAKLLEALDRLPLTMDEATPIPSASQPAIPLYGTYEWQGVVDAKFGLKEARKGRPS